MTRPPLFSQPFAIAAFWRENNVLPVSVQRKPSIMYLHVLLGLCCLPYWVTDKLTRADFLNFFLYCPNLDQCLLCALVKAEFNNVKGTTHAKLNVMLKLAFVVVLVQTDHVIADNGKRCQTSRGRPMPWTVCQDISGPTWTPSHFLRVSKITSPITFMAIREI